MEGTCIRHDELKATYQTGVGVLQDMVYRAGYFHGSEGVRFEALIEVRRAECIADHEALDGHDRDHGCQLRTW
jgi:hypothetical protein